MSDLLALAERCEAAASDPVDLNHLNADILRGLGWTSDDRDVYDPEGNRRSGVPTYTTSVDAALQLIGDEHWRVEDHPLAGPCAIAGEQEGYASTPALALCAAALRARAASTPSLNAEIAHPSGRESGGM